MGRSHKALNGMWTILSLILWGSWEPRKAVSSRPMLTQLGPSIVFNNWDSGSIVVQREERTCGAVVCPRDTVSLC